MKKKLLSVLIISAALVFSACGSADPNSDKLISMLESENASLKEENEMLKAELEKVQSAPVSESEVTTTETTNEPVSNSGDIAEEPSTSSSTPKDTYGLNDPWIVDGEWSLTIESVTKTERRNSVSDKKPTEVIVIKYSYENIGYSKNEDGLFMSGFTVVDTNGELADSYPLTKLGTAKRAPIGSKCVGAETAYGLNNESDTVTINYDQYDSNSNKQRVTFVVPVSEEAE